MPVGDTAQTKTKEDQASATLDKEESQSAKQRRYEAATKLNPTGSKGRTENNDNSSPKAKYSCRAPEPKCYEAASRNASLDKTRTTIR